MDRRTVVLTPKLARHISNNYTGSKKRKLQPTRVERIARMISNHRWNPELYPLEFRSNGCLKRGSETLAACIQVNTNILVEVSCSNTLWNKVAESCEQSN